MSLARPWWLGALVLLLPLLILHLRRPALTIREVPSLLVWERLSGTAPSDTRRLRRPRHPWLLALQAVILTALVVALAGPRIGGSAEATTVFVLDDSFWMQTGTRLADARDDLVRLSADAPGRVAVVAAAATPRVLYRGSPSGVASATRDLEATSANGDLTAAVALGAGELGGSRGHMVVLRAPEDPLPRIRSAAGQLSDRIVGTEDDDQGIFAARARCGVGPGDVCEVVATLRNGSPRARVDSYIASVAGQRSVRFHAAVPARSSTAITLTARPGSILRLRLLGRDALPIDDTALVAVPGTDNAPAAATVTLVGDPSSALPLAQAFASVPGVTLLLRTPKSYRARDARASELVVLDGSLPAHGLPGSPAVLLIDPPALPEGTVGAPIAEPTISGSAPGAALLEGVDLTSLNIDRATARSLTLPPWMQPVVWTPDGPLLAAGDNGSQRVAVLAFDPPHSNLAQLAALPILARNLVGWADGWASLRADGSLSVDALPGGSRATIVGARGATDHDLARRRPGRGHRCGGRAQHGRRQRTPDAPATDARVLARSARDRRRERPARPRGLGERPRAIPPALARPLADRARADRDGRGVGRLAEDPLMANRSRIAGALVVAAALSAIAALADPHVGSRAPRAVLALDRSASIDPSMRASEARWLDAIAAHPAGCTTPCRIVTFARGADVLPVSAQALAARTRLEPGAVATDLERGIAAAVAAAPDGGRVIVAERRRPDGRRRDRCRRRGTGSPRHDRPRAARRSAEAGCGPDPSRRAVGRETGRHRPPARHGALDHAGSGDPARAP